MGSEQRLVIDAIDELSRAEKERRRMEAHAFDGGAKLQH